MGSVGRASPPDSRRAGWPRVYLRCAAGHADATHVGSPSPTASRILLQDEIKLFAFVQRVEFAWIHRRMMEKNFRIIILTNKTEAPVANQANY